MLLRKPALEDKDKLMDYIEEHHTNGETSISACNGLTAMKYEDWIEKLKKDESGENKEWGISETYILEDNNKVIGILNIRYTLSLEMAEIYGNIGYGVRPSERKKGYATYMLKEALIKCKQKGLKEVILGCHEDNLGSYKTIINNNGVIYRKSKLEGKNAVYFKINL